MKILLFKKITLFNVVWLTFLTNLLIYGQEKIPETHKPHTSQEIFLLLKKFDMLKYEFNKKSEPLLTMVHSEIDTIEDEVFESHMDVFSTAQKILGILAIPKNAETLMDEGILYDGIEMEKLNILYKTTRLFYKLTILFYFHLYGPPKLITVQGEKRIRIITMIHKTLGISAVMLNYYLSDKHTPLSKEERAMMEKRVEMIGLQLSHVKHEIDKHRSNNEEIRIGLSLRITRGEYAQLKEFAEKKLQTKSLSH